jgi:HSP20 family protein
MDRLFDHFMSRNWLSPFNFDWPRKGFLDTDLETKVPQVDIIDRDSELVIRCEVPGVDKKDLDVSMTGNTVTIAGATHRDEKTEKGDYYRREISSGSFSRTLSLPCEVDSDKAKASFKDGLLELTAPKTTVVKRRKIEL